LFEESAANAERFGDSLGAELGRRLAAEIRRRGEPLVYPPAGWWGV
jgi:hypothetical protein